MTENIFALNARLRLTVLGLTWEDLAKQAGEDPGNVRGWIRRANPRGDTVSRLARLLGVPEHELLNPHFDPRAYPAPRFKSDGGNNGTAEKGRDQLDDRDGETM